MHSQKAETYYEILQVSPNASQAVIRAAYKSLMQHFHPDKNSDNPEIEQYAVRIGQAFEVLSDPVKRKAYDLELELNASNHSVSNKMALHTERNAMQSPEYENMNINPVQGKSQLDGKDEYSSPIL